ncbi:4'-phosphopantetheinyl transferase domain superfamily [Arabidopsis thaliana x Arabidopsis arenosa]|uniref:4'-phosphopantetheinyl transferase domain superfamily n=1 Tax=Arabidopsis thaliana x Arabidopsis arenosa TaxID=1240361 RepID=A0A8T2FMD3_9BRAS|nr:4'-phosphopantetheinyl transferase domain superfamily [Arabidopsis thaliana x Arabidopsis arenosa]KAG7635670.1 4'-phosphopantetheinyl transferase domain superfamily [Arabidopsis thaliana x Arabidopsis arenosa]KAG7635671.1 4'-phosphopantetheinyl transferase domain superfamily [Arabidopsis thaliana x Arabidopsis arenosa]
MADSGMKCVFVTTNMDNRLGLLMDKDDTVSTFKEKICKEHEQCFPSFGNITISALKVNCCGQLYHLVDSLILNTAFQSNESFLFVDVLRVEEKGKMLTGETPLSNPNLLERETNDLTIKEAPVTQAGDDKTKKRKLKSLDSTKRSHKKRSLGDQSSGKGEVESFAMSPTGKDLEKGEKSAATIDQENDLALVDDENESHKEDVRLGAIVEDINQSADVENEGLNKDGVDGKDADEATTSVKAAKKGRTKKDKAAPTKEDTEVASSSRNVDHDVVIREPQENGIDLYVQPNRFVFFWCGKKSPEKLPTNVSELIRNSVMSQIQRIFSIELPSLVPLQLPSRMETHLWYVVPDEVKSISLLKHYSQILSPSENDKVLQMRGNKLQKNALLARTLVRTTIARYQTNNVVDPRTLIFKKNMYGKPEVDWQSYKNCDSPPLHFNISHTDSLISCGVTVHVPVGIDLEEMERKIKHDVLALAERFYSADEVKFLSAIPDPEVQRKEFIKLWTLKEAYVKALGKGFSGAPFNTFTIQSKAGTNGGYNLCKFFFRLSSHSGIE